MFILPPANDASPKEWLTYIMHCFHQVMRPQNVLNQMPDLVCGWRNKLGRKKVRAQFNIEVHRCPSSVCNQMDTEISAGLQHLYGIFHLPPNRIISSSQFSYVLRRLQQNIYIDYRVQTFVINSWYHCWKELCKLINLEIKKQDQEIDLALLEQHIENFLIMFDNVLNIFPKDMVSCYLRN